MGAPVAYFELMAKDPERIGKFYDELFGWSRSDGGQAGYSLIDTGAGPDGIGGGIGAPDDPSRAGSTRIYMRVDDLQRYLDRAVALGGSVLVPPTPLPGDFGSFAMFADPEGRAVGLWA